MFSEDGEVSSERLDAHVDEVAVFIAATSRTTQLGLRVALLFVWLSPLLFWRAGGRLTTLDRLPVGERTAALARLEQSTRTSWSLAFIGWRTIMTFVFYEDESELRQIGYRHERVRYKRALPMLAAPAAAAAVAGGRDSLPTPLESGVRLRDPHDFSGQTAVAEAEISQADLGRAKSRDVA
jgi:hypothetical protein